MSEPETIDRILDAASDVFHAHGVQKSRMGHVAEAAELSRATLYRYFATKELLVEAFAVRELERMSRRVVAEVEGERRLSERLALAIAFAIETTRETPAIRPFFEPEAHGITLSIPSRSLPMGPSLLAMLLAVVGDHDGEERLRPDLPPNELLEWVVRLVLSLAMVPGPDRSREGLRAFVRRLVRPAFVVDAV